MHGRSSSRVFFKSQVGIGSNLQCLDGNELISFLTAESVTGQNLENSQPVGTAEDELVDVETGSVKEDISVSTFSLKNFANRLES